jgi:hypothetical protein
MMQFKYLTKLVPHAKYELCRSRKRRSRRRIKAKDISVQGKLLG